LASEHLGKYYSHVIKIERIPGGHLATSEQADTLATMIQMLANQTHKETVSALPVERSERSYSILKEERDSNDIS
jgi:hypothetical protein